jgi:hypothetical protein
MNESMRLLGYLTFGALIVAGASATAVLIRELPGLVRYVKISNM